MSFELFFIGLAVTLIFIAITGFYPGGIIVPAYLILFIDQPFRLMGTIIISFIVLGVYRLLSRRLILYGNRRFVVIILFGVLLTFLVSYILPQYLPEAAELKVIGWIIPGLIANQMEKQGVVITLSSLAIVLLLLFGVGKIFFLIF